MGVSVPAVRISADGEDAWGELPPPMDWKTAAPDELKKRIADSGIVGMGGAAFPTHVKLSPPPDKKIDYLILNGAECEPYLTADHRLMLEDPESVLAGAAICGRILGVKNIYIGVEVNKQVRNRIIKKRIHVKVEHVLPSKCRIQHLNRVKQNDAIKAEKRAEKVCLKRIPAQPRAPHTVVPTKPIKTVFVLPYEILA